MTRLRFAPSPTGALHIGGIRTALYNYLLARKTGGRFILRIEDTDQARFVPGAEDYIIRALTWLGLSPDEGPTQGGSYSPYRQSERTQIYLEHAMKLVNQGKAYYAFDSPEELDAMRQRLIEQGETSPKYDASVRSDMVNGLTLTSDEIEQKLANSTPYTIRLLVEPGHAIIIHDKIRGEVTFDSTELDDKILIKADGYPTYHLANVVDDHLMQITDVIRGEEWLPSTAHHVLLYRAFGWLDTMPTFSHLPLILKPNGHGKLSKRDGQKFGFPVFPLAWHTEHLQESIEGFDSYGFEPAAVINFLAFLGWNPGTEQEIFSLDELISVFDAERIHKGGARFDYDKALWFNHQYLQGLDFEAVKGRLIQYADAEEIKMDEIESEAIFKLLKPRLYRLKEYFTQGYYFFTDDLAYDEVEISKKWNAEAGMLLEKIAGEIKNAEPFTPENASNRVKELITASGIKMGVIMPLIRAALTGSIQGPDVFEIAAILGPEKSKQRLEKLAGWPLKNEWIDK